MKLHLSIELTVDERLNLEKRLGGPLSRQVAEHWCEVMLRGVIHEPAVVTILEKLLLSRLEQRPLQNPEPKTRKMVKNR